VILETSRRRPSVIHAIQRNYQTGSMGNGGYVPREIENIRITRRIIQATPSRGTMTDNMEQYVHATFTRHPGDARRSGEELRRPRDSQHRMGDVIAAGVVTRSMRSNASSRLFQSSQRTTLTTPNETGGPAAGGAEFGNNVQTLGRHIARGAVPGNHEIEFCNRRAGSGLRI